MAERLSELGIMIVFGYTLWLIVSLAARGKSRCDNFFID
jgi:hypothetical protein